MSDIVVIGGGAIGLAIAWRTARLGASVSVIEREDPPRGSSWVAAGMLAPVTEAQFGEDDVLSLNLRSAEMYPAFIEDLRADSGAEVGLVEEGTMYLALDRDQHEALLRLYDFQVSNHLDVRMLDSEQARSHEPALSPSVRSAVFAERDRAVDPRELVSALSLAFRRCGGEIHQGEVTRISPRLLTLRDGSEASFERLVLAAGAWTSEIPGVPPEVAGALRPVKGQLMHLRPPAGEPPIISHVIRTEEIYLVPRRGGEVICGATVEEKSFDPSVTAGAIYDLLRAAIEAVPGLREFEITETLAGFRPASRDNAPLIGPTSMNGVIAATGHFRNGILQAPATADGIAQLLVKDELPEELAPFDPRRFQREDHR